MAFVRAMYKKGAGNDKQGKDAGNRLLCPYRNFSQAIIFIYFGYMITLYIQKDTNFPVMINTLRTQNCTL